MFGALIRAAERWRGLRFTEFELRQIAAVRLDAAYEAKLPPSGRSSLPTLFQHCALTDEIAGVFWNCATLKLAAASRVFTPEFFEARSAARL